MGKRLKRRGVVEVRLYFTAPLTRETKLNGTMTVTNSNGSTHSDAQMHTGNMQIKGAGNSTWGEAWKPFNLTLADGTFKKVVKEFLGLPAGSDFRFLADVYDTALSANMLAMDLSEDVGMDWSSDMCKAEVWWNDVFQGSYTVAQKVDKSANRANIGADDFLLERQALSQISATEGKFQDVRSGWWHSFKEPDVLPTDTAKIAVAQARMDTMYRAIMDGTPARSVAEVDVTSWTKYGIVQDLIKNPDGFENSMYYTVLAANPKIKLQPLWDFDVAFGITGRAAWAGLDLDYSDPYDSYLPAKNPMYVRLFRDANFVAGFKAEFNAALPKFNQTLADYIAFTDAFEATGAPARNFALRGGIPYRTRVNAVIKFMRNRIFFHQRGVYNVIPPKAISF